MAADWRGGGRARGGGGSGGRGGQDWWQGDGVRQGDQGAWGGSGGWRSRQQEPAAGGRWRGAEGGEGGEGGGDRGHRGSRGGRGRGSEAAAAAVREGPRLSGDFDAAALRRVALCPDPGRGAFTATFDARPELEGFASVNAGNGRSMRVGGSGLNGQFAKDLAQAGLAVEQFQQLHQDLLARACAAPGSLVQATDGYERAGLQAAFGRVARADGSGFVAVDLFLEERRPLHPSNVAMVYCVGPDRRNFAADDAFLDHLEELGESLAVTCCGASDALAAAGLPPLRRVRVALVSGGKYSGKVSGDAVAEHLLRGLLVGLTASAAAEGATGEPSFELAHADGCFARVYEALRL